MTISLRSRGESLTGLAMGLLVSRQEGWGCLQKMDEAIREIARVLVKQKYPNTLNALTALAQKVDVCNSGLVSTELAVGMINLSQIIAAKFTKGDDALPKQIFCPNPSILPYDPHAVFPIPSHFVEADKKICQKLFMKTLYSQNLEEIRRWLHTVEIGNTINFDELGPEHIQIMLEANPTCGPALWKTPSVRYDHAFVLYINGVRGQQWCFMRIFKVPNKIQEYRNLYYRQAVKKFNDRVVKEKGRVDQFPPFMKSILKYPGNPEEIINQSNFQENFESALMRNFQKRLRNHVIDEMMKRDLVDLDPGKIKMAKINRKLKKMTDLKEINFSILNLITEYCFSKEKMLWEALKKRQIEIYAEIEEEKESAYLSEVASHV